MVNFQAFKGITLIYSIQVSCRQAANWEGFNQGRRKGGYRGGIAPLPFSKGGRGGESALRVKILTPKI